MYKMDTNLLISISFFKRHILASFCFNENLQREKQREFDGKEYIRITYPKYEMGEEVVREVAGPPTYSKNKYYNSELSLI